MNIVIVSIVVVLLMHNSHCNISKIHNTSTIQQDNDFIRKLLNEVTEILLRNLIPQTINLHDN